MNLYTKKIQLISKYSLMPSWNNNSKSVLFTNRAVLPGGQVIGDTLWLYDINTSTRRIISFLSGELYDNQYVKYSPDTTTIVFSSQPYGGLPQVWIINSDGTNPRRLTSTQGYSPGWSPDGEWIVYTDSRGVNGRLWLMRKDGSEKKQLTFSSRKEDFSKE